MLLAASPAVVATAAQPTQGAPQVVGVIPGSGKAAGNLPPSGEGGDGGKGASAKFVYRRHPLPGQRRSQPPATARVAKAMAAGEGSCCGKGGGKGNGQLFSPGPGVEPAGHRSVPKGFQGRGQCPLASEAPGQGQPSPQGSAQAKAPAPALIDPGR